ncbi:MAG TPA: hypothetical protein VKE53_11880 [Pseudolabrys sp.]|jgi:hypothetical protein|nr:hypothetical protein [Pseudolabrys sp.]
MQMPVRQRNATVLPLVRKATECSVLYTLVFAGPRYSADLRRAKINDLIVGSIPSFVHQVQAMTDTHDHMYGRGSEEAF